MSCGASPKLAAVQPRVTPNYGFRLVGQTLQQESHFADRADDIFHQLLEYQATIGECTFGPRPNPCIGVEPGA